MLCLSGFELYSRWVPLILQALFNLLTPSISMNILLKVQHGFPLVLMRRISIKVKTYNHFLYSFSPSCLIQQRYHKQIFEK